MQSTRRVVGRTVGGFCVAAAVIALGALSGSVGARLASKPAPPAAPIIATLDLEAVVTGLNERTDKEASLKSELANYQSKVDKLAEEVKAMQKSLENEPDGVGKMKMAKDFRDKAVRLEFEKQYAQRLLGELQGEMLRELYLKMVKAAQAQAKKNGYALVLASDERVQVPSGDPTDVTRAIAMKRMLHVDTSLDITQEIITLMNNEYAAGRKP